MLSLLDFTFLSFRPGASLGRGNSFESSTPNRDALPLFLETDGCLLLLLLLLNYKVTFIRAALLLTFIKSCGG